MTPINVCLACDNNYAKYAGVVVASVLANSKDDEDLRFYILDGGISENKKTEILSLKSIKDCKIEFVQIEESMFEDYKKVATHKYISIATYYRLRLATLLPEVERIIYFDCDMVVNSSLNNLFNVELGENVIAGVRDINKRMLQQNPSYINAGMVLFDLNKIREENIEQKFYDYTNENFETIKMGDQTIINEVLKGRIKIVEDEWNVQSSNFTNRSSYTKHPYIIHYVAKRKPWHFGSFSVHRQLYFKYLQMTPWKLNGFKEKFYWYYLNQVMSLINYVIYRPLFLFRPRFYEAIFKSYIVND
ncbi:TPA: hypothetical protein CPT80_06700 [Candidatus Gastranaerophilales bacterium HUM_9]|nr:MAG TPA: hypothetical protein CPT80_06700 [Candidatus Gastranaerophilales bacterium HUM_9]HBX35317.1 hypothetical protein [Cyanobacteria bacterium UBA11440]